MRQAPGWSWSHGLVNPVAVIAVLLPIAVLTIVGGSSAAMAAQPGFVTRSGTSLELDGQPYRFTGMNVYNANNLSGCWYPMGSGPTLDESLSAMSNAGGPKVMRSWFFQSLATVGGVRDWSAIDNTLAVAQSHGTKVIVTLGNQWKDCDGLNGGAGSFKDEAWYTGGYTQPDAAGTVSYRGWVAEIVERYKDDSTILAWQLMNEAEVKPSEGSGSCSANAAQILKSFADDVSGLIKSIDANHLVSLGTIGGGQCGAQSEEYQSVHDLSTIDLCEFHDYGSPNVPIPGDQWNGLQVRIDQCNALDKPLFVGETGIRQEDVASLNARANAFRAKFGAQFAAGIAGELVWAWNKDGSPASYDIGPGDPTLGVLDEFRDGPLAVTYGPVLPRATADRPDDVPGPQIHVMYVLPSDGTDRELDTDGTLKNTVESFQTWLAGKTGGRPFRADTFQGSLDISFFQLSRADDEIASFGAFVRDEIENETEAAGFDDPNTIYAVYYDGTSTFSCGGGAWPPTLVGNVAAMYLNGLPDESVPCSSNSFAGPGEPPTYLEFGMLHEVMHTLGFAPACAPHHWRAGHVSDTADDLMWAGDDFWAPSGWANVLLDSGNDDYYRHSNPGCLDLDENAYLEAVVAPTPPPADFDGDGDTDLSVFRPSEGGWYMQGQPPFPQIWGASGDLSVSADYDGDGSTDIAVFRNGDWYVQGQPPFPQIWGQAADVPVPADYDGDGDADIAVFRNGHWYVKDQPPYPQIWGQAGDVPVPADYDGDGDVDIAVFRNGHWYVKDQPPYPQIWGQAGDVPVPGDYDGDGDADIAVFRNGHWYVQGQPPFPQIWGQAGDRPRSRRLRRRSEMPTSPSSETGTGTSRTSLPTRRSGVPPATSRSRFPMRFARSSRTRDVRTGDHAFHVGERSPLADSPAALGVRSSSPYLPLRSRRCYPSKRSVDSIEACFRRETALSSGFDGWAHLGSNQGPLACEASALPLSYAPGRLKGSAALGTVPAWRRRR